MGSVLFNFLLSSPLFDDRLISEDYDSMSEDVLAEELDRYRQFCLENMTELKTELGSTPQALSVFSGTEHVPLDRIKQSALYVERFIVNDPVFAKTQKPTSQQKAMNTALGLEKSKSVDKHAVARAARYVKSLTPFVAADYVKLAPASLLFEPPEQIPLFYSPTGFREALPKSILDFFHAKARELGNIEVANLNQRLRHLKGKALSECGIAAGGLMGSFFTGGWTLLASGVAALQGFRTYSDYRNAVKLNPAYFLWRVLPKQGKR